MLQCGRSVRRAFFFRAEDGIRADLVTGVQTCALPICSINRTLAAKDGPIVPLIAETGGINAMIADATALPEQVADDVVTSAFRSAGQRCSALQIGRASCGKECRSRWSPRCSSEKRGQL